MHLLELISGTGSVGRAFRERGWQVTSVDLERRFAPTICCDVLELESEQVLEHGNVDLIWASPPCTEYSCARTKAKTPRNLEGSDLLVRRVLDLADELFCYYLIGAARWSVARGRVKPPMLEPQISGLC